MTVQEGNHRSRRPWTGRAWLVLLALGLIALVATGCFWENDDETEATATPGPATPSAGAPGDGDDEPATPSPTPAEPEPALMWPEVATATITTEDLNLRSGPGTNHLVIGRLQMGDEVPVSARSSRWLALPGIGWTAYDEDWVELSVALDEIENIPPEDAGFEFIGPLHEEGTESGIPAVDQVVQAVDQRSRDLLVNLVYEPEGADPFDDDAGVCRMPGTELADHLDAFYESEVSGSGELRLYSVVRGLARDVDRDPEFVAVFAFERGESRAIWISGEGDGITGFGLGCSPISPGEMTLLDGSEPFFWFRPAVPESATPVE